MSSIQYKKNFKTGTEIQKGEHTPMLSDNHICVGRILSEKPLQLSKLSSSGCLNPMSGETNERPTWEHLLNNIHKLITNCRISHKWFCMKTLTTIRSFPRLFRNQDQEYCILKINIYENFTLAWKSIMNSLCDTWTDFTLRSSFIYFNINLKHK